MDLNELYRRLAVGELSNLALADSATGTIDEASHGKIVLYTNEALKKLHTRFLLKDSTLILVQQGYRTRYQLSSKYAVSNYAADAGHDFYIQDTPSEPFQDDVLKVLAVYNRHGREMPLNKASQLSVANLRGELNAVFTPQPTLLQVPHPEDGAPLGVQYQSGHRQLTADEPTQEVEIPEFLAEALTGYIASRVFSHMNTQENTAKAQEHMNTFETICVEAVEQDLVSTGTLTSSVRFSENGWV